MIGGKEGNDERKKEWNGMEGEKTIGRNRRKSGWSEGKTEWERKLGRRERKREWYHCRK